MQADQIRKALGIRSSNTLHGINPYTTDGHIIGLVWKYSKVPTEYERHIVELKSSEYSTYEQRIRELVRLDDPNAIWISSSYGGDFLAVKLTHRSKIPVIINAALNAGLCIRMQTKLESFYEPTDAPFSLEKSEQLSLRSLEDTFSRYPQILEQSVWNFGDTRLWKTHAGKAFARKLKAKFPYEGAKADEDHCLLTTPLDDPNIDFPMTVVPLGAVVPVVPVVPAAAAVQSIPKAPKVQKVLEKSDTVETRDSLEICMICMDAPADTMVFPCGDVVVCKTCSEGLRRTNDNKTCVKCRRPIERVVWDGGEEIKNES